MASCSPSNNMKAKINQQPPTVYATPFQLIAESIVNQALWVVTPNAGLQRRGANSRKLHRRKHLEEDAIAASAASHCWARRGMKGLRK